MFRVRGLRRCPVLALAISVIMSACGGDEPSNSAPGNASASTSTSTTSTASTTSSTSLPVVEPPPPIPLEPPDGMELVWGDEFDGAEIDRSNWTYDLGGWGWGNGEAQYYTDRPENARLENGLLVIELRHEPFKD